MQDQTSLLKIIAVFSVHEFTKFRSPRKIGYRRVDVSYRYALYVTRQKCNLSSKYLIFSDGCLLKMDGDNHPYAEYKIV